MAKDRRQRCVRDVCRLLGDVVSEADTGCCAYPFFADQIAIDMSDWPNVAASLDRIKALPGWRHPYS